MRLEGWETRLDEVIESARHREYSVGTHDCFGVACEVVKALTGREIVKPMYSSEEEARRVIDALGGPVRGMTEVFGGEPARVSQARRGDLLLYRDGAGEAHIGICVGANVALLGPDGIAFFPVSECLLAWRVE